MVFTRVRREIDPLTLRESLRRLRDAPVSRLAYVADGAPRIVPVNHLWRDGAIFVHSAKGRRTSVAQSAPGSPVAVEVDGTDPDTRLGWSVVAHGTMHPASDAERLQLDGHDDLSWAVAAGEGTWLRVDVTRVDGRRLVEL
jgi:nitroimidazol reductase NimA-like FMN-containing flavoprotein (pyridoxamine 5'-phosphate oxidase superfamily)